MTRGGVTGAADITEHIADQFASCAAFAVTGIPSADARSRSHLPAACQP